MPCGKTNSNKSNAEKRQGRVSLAFHMPAAIARKTAGRKFPQRPGNFLADGAQWRDLRCADQTTKKTEGDI
jgi:hypothetical protein